ncbi:MAG: NTP transferase domain-containing protein, partial [Clostridia bacterium]|nr:NTP transferase domain-containing protein [Clostridia bacterium]
MSNVSAIIMAAGAGTRMKSAYSKVVHKVCGTPLVQWVYDAGEEAGVSKTVVVVGHKSEQVKECLGENKLYVLQEKQLGTGHAVMCAMPELDDGGCVLVLSGDVPLITSETLKNAIEYHSENRLAATIISAKIDNPFGYGRIIRSETGDVKAIVEEKDATGAQKLITEINSGLYCFDTGLLRAALSELNTNNAQGEYYLTDTIGILLKNGYSVGAYQ